jgi:heme/copper-type cytochrome/quinol oxidase subunit 2
VIAAVIITAVLILLMVNFNLGDLASSYSEHPEITTIIIMGIFFVVFFIALLVESLVTKKKKEDTNGSDPKMPPPPPPPPQSTPQPLTQKSSMTRTNHNFSR